MKQKRGVKIFSYILSALLVIAVAGSLVYFLSRGSDDLSATASSFSLRVGEEKIHSDQPIGIESGQKIFVDGSEDYNVSVYGYAGECDFEFIVGGRFYRWKDTTSIDFARSGGIGVTKEEDGFTLAFRSFEQIVGMGEVVSYPSECADHNLFRLAVSSGGKTISLYFGVAVQCSELVLPSEIEF